MRFNCGMKCNVMQANNLITDQSPSLRRVKLAVDCQIGSVRRARSDLRLQKWQSNDRSSRVGHDVAVAASRTDVRPMIPGCARRPGESKWLRRNAENALDIGGSFLLITYLRKACV